MRKICKIAIFSVMVLVLCAASVCANAKTMYAPDGRTTNVANKDVAKWSAVGWYSKPVVTIYTSKGDCAVVGMDELKTYESLGWYDGRIRVCIYNAKGDVASVPLWQLKTYLKLGWSESNLKYNKNFVSEVNIDSFCRTLMGYWASDAITTDGQKNIYTVSAHGREIKTGTYPYSGIASIVKKVLKNTDNSYDVLLYYANDYASPICITVNMKLSDTSPTTLTVASNTGKIKYTYHTCCYNTFSNYCTQLLNKQ